MNDAKLSEEEPGRDSYVDRLYEELRNMASSFEMKPDERINESTLAKRLGVSRTPLREALNRLCVEGYLVTKPGKGFFRRALDAREIFELYQLRSMVETSAIRLACEHATVPEIDALLTFLDETGGDEGGRDTAELVRLDEQFHENLMRLCRNEEVMSVLANINGRIRFVRWIDMDRRGRDATQSEHRQVVEALKVRDAEACERLIGNHIGRRLEEITAHAREGYGRIYMGEGPKSWPSIPDTP